MRMTEEYPENENWAIQKVMVKTSVPLAEAEKTYKKITRRAPRKVRATDDWYHFRMIPPTKFVPRSYRTKVINDHTHLVLGRLRPEHQRLKGGGIFDYIKRAASSAVGAVTSAASSAASSVASTLASATSISDYSTKTAAQLKRYGDYPVVAVQVRRVPVHKALDMALQGVSGGKWEELKTKYGFDQFYHSSIVVTLKGKKVGALKPGEGRGVLRTPKKLAIEKLEVVSVNENIEVGPGMETIEVAVQQPFTINEMFAKARASVGDSTFFSYSALGGNNCQRFIKVLLEAEGLYSEPVALFVFQDISSLAAELPGSTLAFADTVTHLGALANKYLGVGGARKRGVLKELIAGGGSVEQMADEFIKYLGGRRPKFGHFSKCFDDWVAECKIPLA